jgi:hypothetical protein
MAQPIMLSEVFEWRRAREPNDALAMSTALAPDGERG